ncbi:MAG: FISUMP domain-containing protein, partial [Bacteroidales bacterium]
LNACEVYGVLYPTRVAVTTDGFANDTLSSVLNRPHLYLQNDTTTSSTIRGVCPKGWAVPSRSDMGRMFNFADYKSDTTGGQCPSTGQNNSGTGVNKETSRCMHLQTGGGYIARSNFLRELMATSLAPAVKLGGTRAKQSVSTDPGWNYPDTTRMYSTHSEPVWSYFGEENAGTDRYGFAILPAGKAYTSSSGSYFTSFGMNTLLATSNAGSSTPSSTAISKASLCYFAFAYNPVQPGFAGSYYQSYNYAYNVSVRCVKVKTNL